MLYLITGSDIDKASKKSRQILEALKKKRPEAEVFELSDENFSNSKLEELLYSQGLFEKKYIIKCRRLLENKESKEIIIDKLKELEESDNVFILIEDKLDQRIFKKIEKNAEKAWSYDLKNLIKDDKFIFTIGDAFGKKDRQALWLTLVKAREGGLSAEQVFWQIINTLKNIKVILSEEDLKPLKLHPFVISKTKSQAKNFTEDEIDLIVEDLFILYHESRRGGLDLYERLEKFSLEL